MWPEFESAISFDRVTERHLPRGIPDRDIGVAPIAIESLRGCRL